MPDELLRVGERAHLGADLLLLLERRLVGLAELRAALARRLRLRVRLRELLLPPRRLRRAHRTESESVLGEGHDKFKVSILFLCSFTLRPKERLLNLPPLSAAAAAAAGSLC